jgi:formylglycine-generating enzyme required for sulfatase activity
MKSLRLPIVLALFCLLTPLAGMKIYKAYKDREIGRYDEIFSRPVIPVTPRIVPGKPFINSIGMQFVYLHPGRFIIGSPADEIGRDEFEIQHLVILSKGFFLQTTEVTQAQWRKVMGKNPSEQQGEDLPVYNVSWLDCKKFIRSE